MASTAASVPSQLIRAALLPLVLLAPTLERSAQAQLVWTTVDPRAPQPSAWGGTVVATPPPTAAQPASVPLQPVSVSIQPTSVSPQPTSASLRPTVLAES